MRRRKGAPTVSELHRSWLELVDGDGPFLAVPQLKRVWPQGIPAIGDTQRVVLTATKPTFDAAWDAWDRSREDGAALVRYRTARGIWVTTMLRDVLGWGDLLLDAADVPGLLATTTVRSREGMTIAPTMALRHRDLVGALVWVVDPVDSLRDLAGDDWATSPIDRMDLMLRTAGCPTTIGLVTDGRWWAVVSSAPGTMTASGIFESQTFIEETGARNAFAAILQRRHLVGGAADERLPELFKESVLAAEEITEALGVQVRRAVELVVSAFGEAALEAEEHGGAGSDSPVLPDDPDLIYDAVVTVLMRVVFLLFAQERGLLPEGVLFEAGYGLAGVLDELDDRARAEGEEAMSGTHLVWHRLLATSRALYDGASFEDVRMTGYGGSLFDPGRFPFLMATNERGALRLAVSDRVMLHVLRAVQIANPKGQDARRVSFRDIDVEQIGYIYEGLLGYTCSVASEVVVGLLGADGQEPEIGLDRLDDLAEEHATDAKIAAAILAWVKEDQPGSKPPSASALAKKLREGDSAEDAERALLAVTRDEALRARLRPYIGAIRRDLRGRPTVILPGGLLVVETPSRRNAGAHYTPRSLAEEVAEHALRPLVYSPGPHQLADPDRWTPIASDQILRLRVADIACGSGAFLVAAARYLARKLVEAWHREGTATGSPKELETSALRKVVAQCLFGADINAMAVEMCKLSLWLVSLDEDLPFSFVDDKVLHGNALLGVTSLRQIEAMHIDPEVVGQHGLFEADRGGVADRLELDTVIARVRDRRRQLASEVDNADPGRSTTTKRRMLDANAHDLAQLTRVADGVIAAGLRLGGKPGKALNESYDNLRIAIGRAFPADGDGDPSMLDAIIEQGLTPTVATDYPRWQPLHWPLAVPDVLERGGFDAIIGNPPFLGGQKLTGALGTNVRDWFVNVLAGGTRGSADLVAYFFLRAMGLLAPKGNLGLIATNTLAQGDTREVGMDRMVDSGFTLTRAIQSRSWPAASANLEFAAVWGTRDRVEPQIRAISDGVAVQRISTLLEPAGRASGQPVRLAENAGTAYIGCYVLGMGFVVEPDEAQRWIDEDAANAEVLFPYLNGEDLNSRPDASPSRWVIDFTGWCEVCAERRPAPFARLSAMVKRERAEKPKAVRGSPWWQFLRARPALRAAIKGLDEVLVIARVSKTVMPLRVSNDQVFHEKVVVFATDSLEDQAVLSSSPHQLWAIKYGTTMRVDPTYTPSTSFETLPRPRPSQTLDAIGKTLDSERREIMLRRKLGLTKLYNLVNDPTLADGADADVARLRAIHVELDDVVMAAYGWDDVALEHGFHTYRQMTRWTVSPAARVEILDRLLEENHRRAALQGDMPPPDPSESAVDNGDDEAGEGS